MNPYSFSIGDKVVCSGKSATVAGYERGGNTVIIQLDADKKLQSVSQDGVVRR
jgi:hypothetical protein